MHKKDYYVALALAIIAGFVGGCVSGRLAVPEPVVAQEAPKRVVRVVEAESFRLVDQTGAVRAILEAGTDGSVGLAMGRGGVVRTRFGIEANGNAVLELKDEKAQNHAAVSVTPEGRPSLMLVDKSRVGGVLLGEGKLPFGEIIEVDRPAGSLVLVSKEGRIVWHAP